MTIAFELITGSIADTFGRKISIVISLVADSIIIFLIALSNSFWQIFILLGLWGISTTLASGADQAWAVDTLIYDRKKHLLDSYFSKSRSFYNAGFVCAGLLSTLFLSFTNNTFLWYVRAGLTFVLAIIILIFGREKFVKRKQVIMESVQTTIKKIKFAVKFVKKNPVIYKLTWITFFANLAGFFAESSAIQDFKFQVGIPLNFWGIIEIIPALLGIVIALYSIKLMKKFKNKKYYFALLLFAVLVIYVLALFVTNPFLAALLAILIIFTDDLYIPAEEKWYNSLIPSSHRASIISYKSMFENAALILGIGISGYVVDLIGGQNTIGIGALVIIPSILIFLSMREEKK